jgi:hypothetical protein
MTKKQAELLLDRYDKLEKYSLFASEKGDIKRSNELCVESEKCRNLIVLAMSATMKGQPK